MNRWCYAVALIVLGCSGKVAGDDDSGVDANSNDGNTANDAGSTTDSPINTNGPLAGMWVGYIESFQFGDGSNAVTMTLADNGAIISGTIFFGTGPTLAPPTNPNIGYPPSGDDAREGFNFTARIPVWTAPHFTVSVEPPEVYKQWCELQTSYPFYDTQSDGGCGGVVGYACLPNVTINNNGDAGCSWTSCDHPLPTNIDCAKLQLCPMGACECTSSGCTVPAGNIGIAFDMQLGGNMLNGSATGFDANVHNVHLTKQ